MIMVWPSEALILGVKMRPMTSSAPPAAKGTTNVMGRDG